MLRRIRESAWRLRALQMLGFNLRVVRRVPGAVLSAAGTISSLIVIAAAVVLLLLSDKKLANEVLGFQAIPRIWGVVACSVIVAYGLAWANYEEALLLGVPTNRTAEPSTATSVIAQAGTTVIALPGSNVVQLPEPPVPPPPGTRTELGPEQ